MILLSSSAVIRNCTIKTYDVRILLEAANLSFANVVRPEEKQSIDKPMVVFTVKLL